jgi:hypothetical protein
MHFFNYLLFPIWLTVFIAAVVDCLKSSNRNKARWIVAIVLLPFVGSYLYFEYAQGRYISEL